MTLTASSLPFLYQDFHSGLNTKDSLMLLEDTQARDVLNVQSTTSGAIIKRNGLVSFATPAAVLDSLFAAHEVGPFLIGAAGGNLYSISAAGALTTIKTGLTAGKRWQWFESTAQGGQGPVFGMNGTDTPQQWTGSGSTAAWTASSGAVPNGTMCLSHANRVWVSGVAAFPSRVYWSSITAGGMDSTNWGTTAPNDSGAVDIEPNDGEPITGIGVVGPYLLVGKRHKLFVIYDLNTGANRKISDSIGVASPRSIVPGDSGTYFLSWDRGVYVTNGSQVTLLSDLITPTLDAITPAQRSTACGAFYQGHYYLSVSDGSAGAVNNKTLDYDTILKSWWVQGFGSTQFALWHPVAGDGLYSAKSTSAVVDQCFVPGIYTDNGVAMPWVWRGPWQSPTFYRRRRFPTPYFRKRWRQIRVEGVGTVDLYTADDFVSTETLIASNLGSGANLGGGGTFGGTGTFGGSGTFGVSPSAPGSAATPAVWKKEIYGQGVALAKSLVFGATSSTQDEILLFVLELTDRRDLVVS